ncbi:oligosaccharide flippase family protein [uncultured Polaribacter sp.]|uniref:lipopolysaccharide biosynthesis protein n=1 Tax=uncultured Polaribacter sp. TaxID=174711 RepID=UPI00260C86A2|nr:oligosaccharide flippase family protein [uncultured Polaribacter sp.]
MKKKSLSIFDKFKLKSGRTQNIIKHISISFLYKLGAILANFLLVPLSINYLDNENYGVWLTLSSFIAWFTFFDVGLGNGLRNKLTEAITNNNLKLARGYVSSAYFTIATVSLVLFLVFFGINFFINWELVFNTSSAMDTNLNLLMIIVFGAFCLQLIVKLIETIYLANQNHSIQVKIHFITQVSLLTFVWFLTKISSTSLLIFAIIFSVLPLFVLLGLSILGFSESFKHLKPSFALWKKEYLKEIMGIGFNFFILQIAGVVLFSTDNFIVSRLFSPEEVVPYNIAFKYFSIITMVFTIIVTPYWSSFTEAFVKKDYDWIKKSVKNILRLWLIVPFILSFMLFFSDDFYRFWVGNKVNVSFSLSLSMLLFVLLFTFNMVFVFFLNGISKIRIQIIISIVSIVINIPLSIYFAKNLNLGLSGVILATTFTIGASCILSPIQYFKLINFKAKGIWDR